MSDKPLVILGTARKHSDTEHFISVVFAKTDHKLIDLLDFNIAPYNYPNKYPGDDGFLKVIDEIMDHRAIVFATPVYWYAMSGIMKIFFDRLNDLTSLHKHAGEKLKGKSVFLLAAGYDELLPDGFEIPFQLTAGYFHMHYKGCIYHSTKTAVPPGELALRITPFIVSIEASR